MCKLCDNIRTNLKEVWQKCEGRVCLWTFHAGDYEYCSTGTFCVTYQNRMNFICLAEGLLQKVSSLWIQWGIMFPKGREFLGWKGHRKGSARWSFSYVMCRWKPERHSINCKGRRMKGSLLREYHSKCFADWETRKKARLDLSNVVFR
jgi:hypothetical protein